ncbi:MAG: murein biosynthesis integral membrane protein MurJ [Lentisphaerales bacterium]|nr:murein biosynthesis integral membrane protein MurJ [Lentisphaerales bacterium]
MAIKENISSSALKTGIGNLISRFSGLLRDYLFAYSFGTSGIISAFLTALAFPNLSRRVFGEGALTASFLPLLSDKIEDNEEATSFASNILSIATLLTSTLTIISIAICLVLVFLAPTYTQTIAKLTAFLMPYMIFICLSALLSGILNLKNSFTLPAISSVFFNVFLIFGCLISPWINLKGDQNIYVLIAAVLISGFIQLITLYFALVRRNFKLHWSPDFKSPHWLSVKTLFIPGIIGASVAQISVFSDKIIANFIGPHAVSSLYYAERLTYFPVGIFGVALGVACLPFMSRAISDNDHKSLMNSLRFGLRQTFFLTLPCTLVFYLYHEDILKVIFMRGEFDLQSLKYSSLALMYYLPGIPAFAAAKIILPFYFASKDTKTPVKIAALCLTVNIVLGICLIPFLSHASLALATTASSYLNCCLLLSKSSHLDLRNTLIKMIVPAARIFFSSLSSCIIIYCLPWIQVNSEDTMLLIGLLSMKIILSYLLFLCFHALLGGKELYEIIKRQNLT